MLAVPLATHHDVGSRGSPRLLFTPKLLRSGTWIWNEVRELSIFLVQNQPIINGDSNHEVRTMKGVCGIEALRALEMRICYHYYTMLS
jgi:hypothetical protein